MPAPPKGDKSSTAPRRPDREALAEQLRANLRRRKAQARAREKAQERTGGGETEDARE